MMMMLEMLVFGLGLAVSVYAMAATVGPNLTLIADALAGRDRHFAPLEARAVAGRRVVRRWSAGSTPARMPSREAA